MTVERTAPADLDRVPELFLIAGLAENTVVEFFSALAYPFQQFRRPIDGNAFLVTRDQE